MSVSTRLMLGMGYLVVLLVLLGSVALFALRNLSSSIDAVLRDNYGNMLSATSMNEALEREYGAIHATALGDSSDNLKGRLTLGSEDFAKALSKANQGELSPGDRAALAGIASEHRRFEELGARVKDGSTEEAVRLFYADVQPSYLKLKQTIAELQRLRHEVNKAANEKAKELAWTSRWWIGIITALAFTSTVWLASYLQRTVVGPLASMAKAAHAIGKGEVHRRLYYPRKDELGELADRLNEMVDRVETIQQQLLEQDAMFSQAFEALLDRFQEPIGVVDSSGQLTWSNESFRNVIQGVSSEFIRDINELSAKLSPGFEVVREPMLYRGQRAFGEMIRLKPC